jgi:4-hydroxybenzoate polyprenyltransferase/phosphoserine phosphatase
MLMQSGEQKRDYKVLVVDVDNTLIKTDLLQESVFAILRRNALYLFMLPVWLLKGRAHLKQMLADRVEMSAALLPYQEDLLAYLRAEHAAGRKLLLATASNVRFATAIANHLGIFADVLGSTSTENLKGARKLAHIQQKLGDTPFAYAGDSTADLPIWKAAAAAVLVNVPNSLRKQVASHTQVVREFEDRKNLVKALFKAMRPHQWLKNTLVFVPLVLAHKLDQSLYLQHSILAFIAFCMCASSVYLLNDMLDLAADRQHPSKRFRPFAAGNLSIMHGVVAMVLLLLGSLVVAFFLPPLFLAMLILYYLCTLAYSIWLKEAALIDTLMLASLYTLRLIAGAAAIPVMPSFWLLAFSMFIFLSLALIKRYSELLVLASEGKGRLIGRAYHTEDMENLAQSGIASGYLAVMVMALYINSEAVVRQYARPEALWVLCPIMLYWISRMWLQTRRGEMHDDPVVFAIKDVRTYWLGALVIVVMLVATYWPFVRQFIPSYFL